MPEQDITLMPGVNAELTLAANQAGVSVCQAIRYKQSQVQKLGGWSNFYPSPVSSTPVRDVHAFQGLLSDPAGDPPAKYIGAGSLSNLVIVSCGVLNNITPQESVTNNVLGTSFSLSISSGSNIVTVIDNGSSAGPDSGVLFGQPVAIGNLLMFGVYPIFTAVSANEYTILSSGIANTTISSGGVLPIFETSSGNATVDVILPNNQFLSVNGLFYNILQRGLVNFGGIPSFGGTYQITSIIDSTHFQVTANAQATTTTTSTSSGFIGTNVQMKYYNVIGPPVTAGAYGAGAYGAGAYGLGTPAGQGAGTPVTSNDWALDNWGEQLVAIQQGGPVFIWAPDLNLTTAQPIFAAPHISIGGFVSQPQQMIMLFGTVQFDGLRNTLAQDRLLARWCDSNNYASWVPTPQNAAGSFRIPTGSALIGGVQAPLFGALFTDVDAWTFTWAGQPVIWAWLRVGTGCGLIGQHACDVAQGSVFWAGQNNFYTFSAGGVQTLPCSVWDFFFQNIDRTNQSKVRAASNSYFNEISWFFPLSAAACALAGITYTGENNAYVKLHIGEGDEYEWDYGFMSRSAWVDTTVLGAPIGVDNFGNLLQHETSFDGAGVAINAYFETGYFVMGDGSDLVMVDWIIPDMRWQAASESNPGTVLFTFFTTDYPAPAFPGESGARAGERQYGPYNVTQSTQFINTRMRGRFWRCRIESNDAGTFWRIGKIKFRWGKAGRR